jgi:hypothetical protein
MKIRIALLALIFSAAMLCVPKHASAKTPVTGGTPPPANGSITT